MTDDKDDDAKKPAPGEQPKLHTFDKALLHGAETGEGMVELTADRLREIMQSITERHADIGARYPALVAECPYETRLAVTAWVMEKIVEHAREGGTFRYLIYDRLGFGPDAYLPRPADGCLRAGRQGRAQGTGPPRPSLADR